MYKAFLLRCIDVGLDRFKTDFEDCKQVFMSGTIYSCGGGTGVSHREAHIRFFKHRNSSFESNPVLKLVNDLHRLY